MAKKVQLHTQLSTFSTYHTQGAVGILIMQNSTIYNWLFNYTVSMECTKRFLKGYSSPELLIPNSTLYTIQGIEDWWMPCKFFEGHVHGIIRNAIDKGYYVAFSHVDDYYIPNKTWYKEKHFAHDGLICGYDQEKKTYSIFAYDKNWVYRVFEIPQESFLKGMRSGMNMGFDPNIRAFRAKKDIFKLDPEAIYKNIKEYLMNNLENNPVDTDEKVKGSAVHDYLYMYLDMLSKGEIKAEYADRRILRFVWEHKKCMLDRIHAVENYYHANHKLSESYKNVVSKSDKARLLYAMFITSNKKEILESVKKLLKDFYEEERKILDEFLIGIERNFKDEAME